MSSATRLIGTAADERWQEAPIDELIDHILAVYHRPLDRELPRLESLARRASEESSEDSATSITRRACSGRASSRSPGSRTATSGSGRESTRPSGPWT